MNDANLAWEYQRECEQEGPPEIPLRKRYFCDAEWFCKNCMENIGQSFIEKTKMNRESCAQCKK